MKPASGLRHWLILFSCLLLAACATLGVGGPREVDVPLSRLESSLAKRFPMEQKVLEMFRIQLSQPRLSTLPEEERLLIKLHTAVSTPLTRTPWQGSLTVSSRLAVDAEERTVLLKEARIEHLHADGIDSQRGRLLQRVADFVADHLLENAVLHRFDAEELRYLGTQYQPTLIRTTADGLRIRFEAQASQ